MAKNVLEVIIDERTQLEDIDPQVMKKRMLLKQAARFSASAYSSRQNVYKDYLLSSEVFYIDSDL